MQLEDLKQIETGHYILYQVKNRYHRAAFKDWKVASDVYDFMSNYIDEFWEDFTAYVSLKLTKEVAIFDGKHFILLGDKGCYSMEELSRYNSVRTASKSGPQSLETDFARRVLSFYHCPVLRRRGWFMDGFCCYTLLCCCFGRAIKV